MNNRLVYSFDFDGVITTGKFTNLIKELKKENKNVVIVTGRCYDESEVVFAKLNELGLSGLNIPVYFNPIPLEVRGSYPVSTKFSSQHKAHILSELVKFSVVVHFEDELLQANSISASIRPTVPLVERYDLNTTLDTFDRDAEIILNISQQRYAADFMIVRVFNGLQNTKEES